MEFNTIDGFQGREVDILLLSTVRASGSRSETPGVSSNNLGFVADVRRMNVALTRAKLSLWIIGNARTLQTNRSWEALVRDAKQRNSIVSVSKPYSSIYKVGSGNRPSSRSSSNFQLDEVERLKTSSECVNTQKKIVKLTSERKRKCIDSVLGSVSTGQDASPSAKDAAEDVKKRARDGKNLSPVEEVRTVVNPNSDNKVLKGAMSKLEQNQENFDKSRNYRDNEKEINVAKADFGKGKDKDNIRRHPANTGKLKNRSQEHPRPTANELHSKTSKQDKLQEVKMSTSSSEGSFKEKGERGGLNQVEVPKDSIMKRKQQREAVDALLSSALISSKKSGSVVKSSSKRTVSKTDTSIRPVRPHKQKNG